VKVRLNDKVLPAGTRIGYENENSSPFSPASVWVTRTSLSLVVVFVIDSATVNGSPGVAVSDRETVTVRPSALPVPVVASAAGTPSASATKTGARRAKKVRIALPPPKSELLPG
jgi:hypothetical protein